MAVKHAAEDVLAKVDKLDNVIGSVGKHEAHRGCGINGYTELPLHRAFSVLLFNDKANAMLLQQRAQSKATFSNCWANACCSHQLVNVHMDRLYASEALNAPD